MVSNDRAEVFAASALKSIKKIQDAFNCDTFLISQVIQNTDKFPCYAFESQSLLS